MCGIEAVPLCHFIGPEKLSISVQMDLFLVPIQHIHKPKHFQIVDVMGLFLGPETDVMRFFMDNAAVSELRMPQDNTVAVVGAGNEQFIV